MIISKLNPITGHDLTLMPPTPNGPDLFGWIRLLNGGADAGYIYLVSPPIVPHLSFDGSYIVTSMPISELQTMLNILKSEVNDFVTFKSVSRLTGYVYDEVPIY